MHVWAYIGSNFGRRCAGIAKRPKPPNQIKLRKRKNDEREVPLNAHKDIQFDLIRRINPFTVERMVKIDSKSREVF